MREKEGEGEQQKFKIIKVSNYEREFHKIFINREERELFNL